MKRWVRWAALMLVAASVGPVAFVLSPLPPGLLDYRALSSLKIFDRHHRLMREVRSSADGRCTPLSGAELSPHLRAAFLAAEDHRFFSHPGLSLTAIVRAAKQNLAAGSVVSGGSTISQQLARTLVPRPRTLWGKTQEALWALKLEAHLSKEEILTQYLNRISFGNNAFGVEAAAQLYFGKKAEHLSLGQAALLASIPRGPTAYDPLRHLERVRARRTWVLSRLEIIEAADADAIALARAEPLDLSRFESTFLAPHFVAYVQGQLNALGLRQAVELETTLDLSLQADVERVLTEEISRLTERRVGSAAAVVVDNETQEVLAYAGSIDFFSEAALGQNDGVQMRRQPGSALKPFVYAEAFSHGYTPATVVADLETAFNAPKGSYSPKNYDRRLHGPVRVREALASSYNVPAVKVAEDVGLRNALEVLRRAGFESLSQGAEHYGLGLALGNGEVSLWEAARAYSGLARGGVVRPLTFIRRALDAEGRELQVAPELRARRFTTREAAQLVTHVLSDNSARVRAFGLDNALRLPFPTAAKTGTSKGYSDNWTVGFTAERTVAVWAGNFDGTPMVRVSGITGAGPVFKRVMTRTMEGLTPRALVDVSRFDAAEICPLSGARAGPSCPVSMRELFVPGTAPAHACTMHRQLSQRLPPDLAERCLKLAAVQGRLVDLGLEYYDWARNEGLAEEPWLAAACLGDSDATVAGAPTAVLNPTKDAEYLLLSDLPLADQAIPVRVRATPEQAPLSVWVDGTRELELRAPFTGRIAARAGAHVLEVKRADGTTVDSIRFVVRR